MPLAACFFLTVSLIAAGMFLAFLSLCCHCKWLYTVSQKTNCAVVTLKKSLRETPADFNNFLACKESE